jgi:predicted ester cyclase
LRGLIKRQLKDIFILSQLTTFKEPSLNFFIMPNKNSTLTYRWFQEVWNNSRKDAIDEMLDDNAIVHGIEGVNTPGPEGFKVFYDSFKQQFPQVHVEVEEAVSEGEYETSRCTVHATTANDQKVTFSGMTHLKIKNNKIVEAWNNFDFLSMYQQLGFKMALQEEVV